MKKDISQPSKYHWNHAVNDYTDKCNNYIYQFKRIMIRKLTGLVIIENVYNDKFNNVIWYHCF